MVVRCWSLGLCFLLLLFLGLYEGAIPSSSLRSVTSSLGSDVSTTSNTRYDSRDKHEQEQELANAFLIADAKQQGTGILLNSETWGQAFRKGQSAALKGGYSGFVAGIIQVLTLMWLRTTVNYQYRYGKSLSASISELYAQGGFYRFYKGLGYALVQGPLTRFGAVAANELGREMMRTVTLATMFGTILASLWRVFLMPVDTCKTVLQVEGSAGFENLKAEVFSGRISSLYRGSLSMLIANMLGHYSWFFSHNLLDDYISPASNNMNMLIRSGIIGFAASVVSDIISNSMRVVKTYKQSSYKNGKQGESLTYVNIIRMVLSEGGFTSLLFRGINSRILSNGLQSVIFTVCWKFFQQASRPSQL